MPSRYTNFALIAVLASTTPSIQSQAPTAKILKSEVDGLVRALRQSAHADGALGDGTCRQTAMVLTALGHCHRFYHSGDGPWVRTALDSLFAHRRSDGAFADGESDASTTTAWVLEALVVLDPDSNSNVLEQGSAFLAKSQSDVGPFAAHIATLRRETQDAADPIKALTNSAVQVLAKVYANGPGGPPNLASAPEALVHLVACQAVARGDKIDEVPEARTAWSPTQERGALFLMSQQADGVFGIEYNGTTYPDVGLTGIGLSAVLTKPETLRSPAETSAIEKGLTWLREAQNADGSFGRSNVNYSTCAAVMALAAAGDETDREALDKAQHYIVAMQNAEGRGYASSDRDYGSIGYGGDERGDLSNLQFAIEALRNTNLDENHEAFVKAVKFLQRTQNLHDYNDFKGKVRSADDGSWHEITPGNDGGSAYYPGNSPAGYMELPDGTRVPRSYGSMSYALLKTYTLCGVPADDPRVVAAVSWVQNNWSLEVNPGVDPKLGDKAAYQGLYYYYMVMAQALDLVGIEELDGSDAGGIAWRQELASHLANVQRDDGSWINQQNGRWWEDQPMVCTVYAMLALHRCDA